MVGYAYQLGALPLSAESIERAIELNGEAVPMNLAAFQFGRRAAFDLASVEALIKPAPEAASDARRLSQSFDEIVARRVAFLTDYQNADYAARYKALVGKVQAAEAAKAPGKSGLAEAVARYLFKLMAYKDEYEVARLYAEPSFLAQVKNEVAGDNLHAQIPPRAAAVRAQGQGDRPAEEDDARALDAAGVPRAREVQVPARHRARHLRLFGRAPHRAQADRRLRGDARRDHGQARRRRTITSRSASPTSRKRSAASAT